MAAFLLAVLSVVPCTLLRAWAITSNWAWFVVPLGLPQIGLMHAMGLTVTGSLFLSGLMKLPTKEESERDAVEIVIMNIFISVAMSLLALLFGFIYHALMVVNVTVS